MSSHNYTGVDLVAGKPKITGLTSNAPVTMLKTLERLGLLGSTDQMQTLVANGSVKLSALGEKHRFFEYEVDAALKKFEASPVDRMTFKGNLERAGLMKKNPI